MDAAATPPPMRGPIKTLFRPILSPNLRHQDAPKDWPKRQQFLPTRLLLLWFYAANECFMNEYHDNCAEKSNSTILQPHAYSEFRSIPYKGDKRYD